MKSNLLILPALALVGLLGYTGIAKAYGGVHNDQMAGSLANKLGVSEEKVTTAFDELHSERQAEMQTRQESRLQELVDSGKLTASQKDLLLAKMKEMQEKREAERSEFRQWAGDNGINLDEIGPLGMGGGHGMMRGGL